MTRYDTDKDYIIVKSVSLNHLHLSRIFTHTIIPCISVGPVVGCLPVPVLDPKPSTGMWDWVENAVYDGRSSKVTGEPLDFWASNKNVSKRILVNMFHLKNLFIFIGSGR